MSIRFSQWSDTGRFITPHFTRHTTSEGLEFYVLSGVVIVGLRATEDGDWLRERLEFGLLLPELPAGKALRLKHWAPFVTINAVQNGDAGHQGGHAVDAFGMLFTDRPTNRPWAFADLAVKNRAATLHRVGYNISLLGQLVDGQDEDDPAGPLI